MGSGWRYGEEEDFTIRTIWNTEKGENCSVAALGIPLKESAVEPLVVNAELATRT
ncbi:MULTISPECIES: hypothetical protein [unclassified Nitrosospira]|uniref:hypothetical protein n=1 Tax=unclassified Nitrosospira TaxID=2609267 RepID=UPI0015A1C35E|nr:MULTISPECIES: hypothetical protein [unclassified Nitrosospira]